MNTQTQPYSLRLPPETKAKLQKLADKDNRTLSGYIKKIVAIHLEENKELIKFLRR